MLAICSNCGFLIVFVCLSFWYWGLGVNVFVSVSEFTYIL